MKQRTSQPLSTLLFDEETGDNLIRVSIWVNPEDLEIESEIEGPTIPVKVQRGRTVIYGKVQTAAYKTWLTKDEPEIKPVVPMPTSGMPTPDRPVLRAFVR